MDNIKRISDGLNWSAIPKIIKDEFCKYGNIRSSVSTRNSTGQMDTTYGDYLHPYKIKFKVDELEYFCIERYYDDLVNFIKNGVLFDSEGNQLTLKTIKQYLIEYAKGFQKGYLEYESTLKNTNTIFQNASEQIAHKVFSRVYGNFTIKSGNFKLTSEFDNEKTNVLKSKHSVKLIMRVTSENFFQSGIEGGEFYKAWEIILNNPPIFKTIFDDNITKPIKPDQKEDMILIDNGIEITIFEKIKRELNSIHWVFKSQFEPKSTQLIFPRIREDGRYCSVIYMRSDIELLKIENYKNYYYKRFESTSNIELIKSELLQLLEKAKFLLKFYNENLTIENNLVNDVIQKLKDNTVENRRFHTAIILIENLEPQDIFFGYDGGIYNSDLEWTTRKYNYASNNNELARFCSKLIEFIETFGLDTNNKPTNDLKINKPKAFKLNGIQNTIKNKAIDLHNSLVTKQYLNEDCKKDFVKLFTGQASENKITWLGQKGELKSFIEYLISFNKIENCKSNKWQITAANFKYKDEDFTPKKIKDGDKAKNDIKIKQIVQRIN
jgi:hypothetical protein